MDRSYDRDREDRSRYRSGDWDRGEEYRRRDWEDRSRDWGRRTGNRVENWAERTGDRLENWADRAGNQVRSWFDDDDDRRRGESRYTSYDTDRGDRDRLSTSYNYGRESDRDLNRGGTVRRDYDFGRRHLEDSGYSDRWHGRDNDNDWSREHPRSRQYGPTSQSSLYDTPNRSSYGSSGTWGTRSEYRGDRDRDLDRERDWRSDRGREWRGDLRNDTNPEDRGMFERAGDEVRSWFGDDDAERRRRMDERRDRTEDRREDRRESYGRSRDDSTWW